METLNCGSLEFSLIPGLDSEINLQVFQPAAWGCVAARLSVPEIEAAIGFLTEARDRVRDAEGFRFDGRFGEIEVKIDPESDIEIVIDSDTGLYLDPDKDRAFLDKLTRLFATAAARKQNRQAEAAR